MTIKRYAVAITGRPILIGMDTYIRENYTVVELPPAPDRYFNKGMSDTHKSREFVTTPKGNTYPRPKIRRNSQRNR